MLQRMLRAWNLVVYHERGRHGLAASRSAASAPPASPHHPSPPAALLCHGASGQGTSTYLERVAASKIAAQKIACDRWGLSTLGGN